MKTALTAVLLLSPILVIQPAAADVYRCEQDGKKIVYQQTPCDSGNQTAIDGKAARKVREQEERKKVEEQRSKEKT